MKNRDPILNFEEFWTVFYNRYPFFELHGVDWQKQYDIFKPQVTAETSDDALFEILCQMLDPLNDGHVELRVKKSKGQKKKFYTPEKPPRFYREFSDEEIKQLFDTTAKTLGANGFGAPSETKAWMLHYCRSRSLAYIRILELEDIKKKKLTAALDKITRDFKDLEGFIIDIRDCPGGDDDTAIQIINRFCDTRRVAFHRRTKNGPGNDDYSKLKTWHLKPEGASQFTGPIALLTCDAVFSGGEAFAMAIKELPHVTIIGDHTNGIFSYTLDKKLPNGWKYCLSYQKYFSADMVCLEGKGVAVDIELFNKKADIANGVDPLISRAIEVLQAERSAKSPSV